MSFVQKHKLLTLFIIGLLLRLGLMFLDYSFDVNNHIVWAQDMANRGTFGFYDRVSSQVFATKYPNYPPLALAFFYIAFLFYKCINVVVWWLNISIPVFPSTIVFLVQERFFLAGILKLPAIIADLGMAWMIYLFAKQLAPQSRKIQLLVPSLVLFNPVFFYNSAYWGQIDVIPLLFAVSALYEFLYTTKYIRSAILFTLGILVKPTILIFLPIFAIIFIKKYGWKRSFIGAAICNTIFWLSFLPFITVYTDSLLPYRIFSEKILAAQSLPFVTNGAFNAWMILTQFKGIKDTAPFLFGLPYRIWGYGLSGILTAFVVYHVIKKKNSVTSIAYALFLIAYLAFLFLTKMHERYLMLPLPFFLLLCIKHPHYFKWFYIVSFCAFINLYHSWAVPKINWLYALSDTPFFYTLICLLNLGVFGYFLRMYVWLPEEIVQKVKTKRKQRK